MNITASDFRTTLIRFASTLPKGSEERRAILAGFRQAEEKWIQDAVKRPGALSKRLGIPEDEDIPVSKIKSELAKLKKKSEKGDLTADEKLFQKQLNFALTMKTKVDKKATDRPQGGSMSITAADRRRLIRLASTLPKGSPERRAILASFLAPVVKAPQSLWKSLLRQLRFSGWELADVDFWGVPTINKLGLDAEWGKEFVIGTNPFTKKPVTNRYKVNITVRLQESLEDTFDADVLMSWGGPGVFGGQRSRKMWKQEFPQAFVGSGRQWEVDPQLVRWIQSTFPKVEKFIQVFVDEDAQEHEARIPEMSRFAFTADEEAR